MKAEIGDYIKTKHMDYPLEVIFSEPDLNFYTLSNASFIDDSEITYDDVLLVSEVIK